MTVRSSRLANQAAVWAIGVTTVAAGTVGVAGCGGGGSASPAATSTTSATAPALETVSMGATSDAALTGAATASTSTDAVEGAALNAGSLTDVNTTDALLTTTGTYLAPVSAETRASTTHVVGGVTVTTTVTPISLTSVNFTITLNGTANATGVTYTNFVFATGVATRGTNNGLAGTHFTAAYNQLRAGATATLATSDSWVYLDGSTSGSVTYAATDTTVAWTETSAKTWTWTLYQNGSATTGTLRGSVVVNADFSGTANLYCAADGKLRSQVSFTGTGSGQFCRYMTTCTPNGDKPCVNY